jgi:hypothetical protein
MVAGAASWLTKRCAVLHAWVPGGNRRTTSSCMNGVACILFGSVGFVALLALVLEDEHAHGAMLFPGMPTWGIAVTSLVAFLLSAWFGRRHRKEQGKE